MPPAGRAGPARLPYKEHVTAIRNLPQATRPLLCLFLSLPSSRHCRSPADLEAHHRRPISGHDSPSRASHELPRGSLQLALFFSSFLRLYFALSLAHPTTPQPLAADRPSPATSLPADAFHVFATSRSLSQTDHAAESGRRSPPATPAGAAR
jgi:hypothetical protein